MSLYIGNNGTEKVLHIYNGSPNIEKNVFSGTAFHSSLPYFSVVAKITFSFQPGITSPLYKGGVYSSSIAIPSEGQYDKILIKMTNTSGVSLFFPMAETHMFPDTVGDDSRIFIGDVVSTMAFTFTSSTSGIFYTENTSATSSHNPYFNNFNTIPYATFYFISNKLSISPSSINISRSGFTVNNSDVLSRMYLYPLTDINSRVNLYDEVIAIPTGGWAGSKSRLNYVSTTDDITFTNSEQDPTYSVNSGYLLFQVLNSYNYPISSIDISSKPASISVVKNNISMLMFTETMQMRASITYSTTINVSANVYSGASNGYFNKSYIGTYGIPSGNSASFVMISYIISDVSRDISVINIRGSTYTKYFNGASVPIYVRGTGGYIEGVLNTTNNTILVQLNYGPEGGSSTQYYGFSFEVTVIT